ncbi:MAG: BREX-1 system phosphatase PglZ type A [Sulfuricellaceae bacterium]|nr:BREX-1 system phosphatase PglZ type A [Sulfuricellaceae bacterium]
MSEGKIGQALTRLFEKHRIVFWYDNLHELRADYEALELPGIEKVELTNNEFGVKHRILREQPEQKFLLYRDGPQPPDLENWLLDVQLAHEEFRTTQVAMWLAELDLGPAFAEVVQAHAAFFEAGKRKEALKKLLKSDDSASALRLKLLAVCAGAEPRLDVILEALLADLAEEREERTKLVSRCGLDTFLWQQMQRSYGYDSKTPGLRDFVIELFKSCFAMATDGSVANKNGKLSAEALVFLKRWKDSRQYESSFETLSEQCADVLGMEQELHRCDARDLLEVDFFELIDLKILSDMVQGITSRTLSAADVAQWVRQRRQGHWYGKYADLYSAVDVAADFIHTLAGARLEMASLAEGVQNYARSWFRLDQLYRKFICHARKSGQASLLADLNTQVENLYSNNYLLKLNNNWQIFVDAAPIWDAAPIVLQRRFFSHWVQPFLERKAKVCVLISDAFRYEIGDELHSLIRQEDRFEAELSPALSMLPSYTQLGMAALLPNTTLTLVDNDSGLVLVDGQSAQGTVNRGKILAASVPASKAIQAEELIQMGRDESRALVRDHDVIYVYHNLIDKTGDTRDTEERVFAAAEETLQELIRIIKKLTNANANNVLVTADHGFLYQNRVLEESDFMASEPQGDVLYRDRRFVLGTGLRSSSSFKSFMPAQLGLEGTMEVQIPKSISRLRLKGSGSRFVHGGATLQEVVIPVLRINKKRQSDVSRVEVEIIGTGNKTITSGQVAVVLYQTQAVTEKRQGRSLRAGIYTLAGELVSDSHELKFDLVSDNPRDREMPVRFVLSRKADEANGQQVVLRLEEPMEGTSHHREYKTLRYTIRRSFTSDFDF